MGQPITTTAGGVCFAFPNVCMTTNPAGVPPEIPIPYPSIGQLSATDAVADTVKVGNKPVVIGTSTISSTTGDEAGNYGVNASPPAVGGKVEFKTTSTTVFAHGEGVVRMFDTTSQNNGNAVGTVLGGVPTVLVGG